MNAETLWFIAVIVVGLFTLLGVVPVMIADHIWLMRQKLWRWIALVLGVCFVGGSGLLYLHLVMSESQALQQRMLDECAVACGGPCEWHYLQPIGGEIARKRAVCQ